MAREFAKTNVTIWQDADWRETPSQGQHLYLMMWTHPALSYCGLLDWRPGRLAQFAGGTTAADVRLAGDCLQERHLIVVDEETEEALLRSWIRFDGVVGHDKLSVSMAKAFAAVASNTLRGVIVDELHKLRMAQPELCGWKKAQVIEILGNPRIAAKSLPVPSDPFSNASRTPASQRVRNDSSSPLNLSGSSGVSSPLQQHLHPQPEHQHQQPQSSSTPGRGRDPKGSRIPADFEVTEDMRTWAADKAPTVDLGAETEKFVDYWRGQPGAKGVKSDWVSTWRNWIRKAIEWAGPAENRGEGDWMNNTSGPRYVPPYADDANDLDAYTRWYAIDHSNAEAIAGYRRWYDARHPDSPSAATVAPPARPVARRGRALIDNTVRASDGYIYERTW